VESVVNWFTSIAEPVDDDRVPADSAGLTVNDSALLVTVLPFESVTATVTE